MYYVYILANWNNQVLYVGVTNNLQKRLFEHIHADKASFTTRCAIYRLVYYEATSDIKSAITREKQLKAYRRAKKNSLVEAANPSWIDLAETW